MANKGLYSVVLLAAIPLQCTKDAPPAHVQIESAAKGDPDVVHISADSHELVGIELERAQSQQCHCVLKAMGKVLAPQPKTAIVGHAFPAHVAQVHVEVGEWVEKGQSLVNLESNEVGTAKSEFFKAIADLELAKLNFTREERLLASKIGVEKNFLEAEAGHKIAQANREAAEKKLHVLGFTEEHVENIAETHQINPTITLYAPISGKIVSSQAILGAQIDQGTEVMTVIDPRLLWIDAAVYEKDIAKVKIGQKVEIAVPAYKGELFQGVLSYIGDMVDEDTRTITVRAEVENDQQRLKPGMFADVDIYLNGGYEAIVIPTAAILESGDKKIVFVKEGDCFRRREVVIGPVEANRQQIVDGLAAGEEVVVVGSQVLESERRDAALGGGVQQHAHVH